MPEHHGPGQVDQLDERRRSDRVEEIVRDLIAGRRLRVGPGDDRDAVRAAARMAAAREGYPRMSAAFRSRLAAEVGPGRVGLVSRRRALFAGAAGIAAVAGGLAGIGIGRLTEPGSVAAPGPGSTILPEPGHWIDVAALTDLPEGQGVRVAAGAVSAYLFRRGDQVTAVSAICSHLPCGLDWMPKQGVLLCPCHQQTFTPSGRSTAVHYPMPDLSQVMVHVNQGRVLVMGT